MTDKEHAPPRYLVREGCKGWMVYDRERKGPAMVGTNPAVSLTRERANHIAQWLTAELQDKPPTSGGLRACTSSTLE
jgi:hypothetical protein